MGYLLTDNFKSRDASASKKTLRFSHGAPTDLLDPKKHYVTHWGPHWPPLIKKRYITHGRPHLTFWMFRLKKMRNIVQIVMSLLYMNLLGLIAISALRTEGTPKECIDSKAFLSDMTSSNTLVGLHLNILL